MIQATTSSRAFLGWLVAFVATLVAMVLIVWQVAAPAKSPRPELTSWQLSSGALRSEAGVSPPRPGEAVPAGIWTAEIGSVVMAAGSRALLTVGSRLEVSPTSQLLWANEELTLASGSTIQVELDEIAVTLGVAWLGPTRFDVGGRIPARRSAVLPQPGVPIARPPEPSPETLPPTVRVLDATSGHPLAGVSARVVFFHASMADSAPSLGADAHQATSHLRAFDAWGAATVPALGRLELEADANGVLRLENPDPGNARAAAYLVLELAGYAPEPAVVTRRGGRNGAFGEVTVLLRRADTIAVHITDEAGNPLADLPVRVTPWRGGARFLEAKALAIGRDRRLLQPDAPTLRHTDDAGSFRVPVAWSVADFELLDPRWFLAEQRGVARIFEPIRIHLPWTGSVQLLALPRVLVEHVLVDQDGGVVPRAELVVALEGMPPLRVRTGDDGGFVVGVTPFEPGEAPLGFSHPRRGTLATVSPELLNRSVPIELPQRWFEIEGPARPAPTLRFRALSQESNSAIVLDPDGVFVAADLTLLRAERSGEALWAGALSPAPALLELFVSGYLPRSVPRPAVSGELHLDLGDVVFERGVERSLVFTGAPPDALRSAVLTVEPPAGAVPGLAARRGPFTASRGNALARHRFAIGEDGHVRVTGLLQGNFGLAVEGPLVKPYQGFLRVDEATAKETLEHCLELSSEEDVVVSGQVVEITPEECQQVDVHERFDVLGSAEPLVFPPYRLARDGRFGSWRRLRGVLSVHVAMTSVSRLSLDLRLSRQNGPPQFFFPEARLAPLTRLEVSFVAEGLGRVGWPKYINLEGEGGIEAMTVISPRRGGLQVFGVRPGDYFFKWRGAEIAPEEIHGFRVDKEQGSRIELVIQRRPGREEVVEFRVVDSAGAPIPLARAEPAPPISPLSSLEEPEPGVVAAHVEMDRENLITISAPEYLPARWRLLPGGRAVNEVTLYRSSRLGGRIFDVDRRPFSGRLAVSWTPLTPNIIEHGTPLVVAVEQGRLEATALPPLALLLTFRAEGTPTGTQRRLTLLEGGKLDAGDIHLAETRRLEGRVLLENGEPAAGALVALVPRSKAYRLPLQEDGLAAAVASVRAEAEGGRFAFDALPVELGEDLVLVARGKGYLDAVEDPLSLAPGGHELALAAGTRLEVQVGYADGKPRDDHGFWLEYLPDPGDPDSRLELGELPPNVWGRFTFEDVPTGLYRVRWGLRHVYQPLPGRYESALLSPGGSARLDLKPEGSLVRGRATFNKQPLDKGWVLLTDDPGTSNTWIGRVEDGGFVMVDPPLVDEVYVALIPQRQPQSVQNLTRGEALPVRLRDYRAQLARERLDISYESHDLTLQLGAEFLAQYQGAVLSLDHQVWDRDRFRAYPATEVIESTTVRLQGLRPGAHRIEVRSARGSMLHSQVLRLESDLVMRVR